MGFGFFALCLFLSSCSPAPTPPALVIIRAAATDLAYPLLLDLSAGYRVVVTGEVLQPRLVTAAELRAGVAAGEFDLGLTAAPDPGQFATPLGYVALEIVVHPQNTLDRLSLDQAREIFLGRVTDWSQVGGAPGGIQLMSRAAAAEAAAVFQTGVLAGRPPAGDALLAPTWDAMRELVSQNPAAVGYLPAAEGLAGVKALRLDQPLRALLAAAAAAEPQGAARDFLSWVQSPAGQAIVARRYLALP